MMSIGSISDGSFSKIDWRCTDGISRSYEKSVDVPCYCKKKPVCKKSWFVTAASHGSPPRPLRLSPGGRSRPRLRAQALRLQVSGSLSLSLSISLSRGSLRLPESPRLSPSHHRVPLSDSDHDSKLKARACRCRRRQLRGRRQRH